MQHDLIRQLRRIALKTLTPIITNRVREDVSRPREGRRADRPSHFREPLESVFSILVPKMEGAVAASRAERAVDGVERYVVDTVDITDIPLVWRGDTMAFEGEIEGGVFLLNILDCAAAFYAADSEAIRFFEAGNYSRLPFEW